MSNLVLHCGGEAVTREVVEAIPIPESTDSWRPVAYANAIGLLHETIAERLHRSPPHDWIFAECQAVAERLDESDVDEDGDWMHEHADRQVDIYTSSRFEWATQFCLTNLFCEAEATANDMYESAPSDTVSDRLGVIQYCAIRRITEIFYEGVKEHLR